MSKVRRGGRPSRPQKIYDQLWMVVENTWDQSPAKRPSAQSLVGALTMASSAHVDFLSQILATYSPPTPYQGSDLIIQDLERFSREDGLSKVLDFRGADAQCAMDVLDQVRSTS